MLQKNIDDAVNGRTISFETGSAAITKAGQTVLKALVAPLKAARGSARVVVGGYTDDVGDAKANLRLSRARANSVKVFLVKLGVSAKRLIATGIRRGRSRSHRTRPRPAAARTGASNSPC